MHLTIALLLGSTTLATHESCPFWQLDPSHNVPPMSGDPVIDGPYALWAAGDGGAPTVTIGQRNQILATVSSGAPKGFTSDTRLAKDGADVYLVYLQTVGSVATVWFARSANYGQTWTKPVYLGNALGSAGRALVASAGGNVYVAWLLVDVTRNGIVNWVVRTSTDGGQTFGKYAEFNPTIADSNLAAIAAIGSKAYLVWNNTTAPFVVYEARTLDAGANWAVETVPVAAVNPRGPKLVVDAGGVGHLVYRTDTPNAAWYRRAPDAWNWSSAPVMIASPARQPNVEVDSGDVYLTWLQVQSGQQQGVFFSSSPDDGVTWGASVQIGAPTGLTSADLGPEIHLPQVYAYQGYVRLAWSDTTTAYTSLSKDNGVSWTLQTALGAGFTALPAGNLVIWQAEPKYVDYAVCQ